MEPARLCRSGCSADGPAGRPGARSSVRRTPAVPSEDQQPPRPSRSVRMRRLRAGHAGSLALVWRAYRHTKPPSSADNRVSRQDSARRWGCCYSRSPAPRNPGHHRARGAPRSRSAPPRAADGCWRAGGARRACRSCAVPRGTSNAWRPSPSAPRCSRADRQTTYYGTCT